MHLLHAKLLVSTAVFMLVFVLGYWLHHLARPYPTPLLTVHKLISLALLIYLVREVLHTQPLALQSPFQLAILIFTALLWITTILSGGFLSMEREWPAWVAALHQSLPYLTLAGSAYSLYLMIII